MATQQEVIKTFMQSLDKTELSGRAALDEAIQASSNFKNFEEVRNSFAKDFDEAKNWHTFLVEKCGIILDNADTGAITGSDAGGTEKTAETILPSKGKAKYPKGTSFTVKGLTIYGIPDENLLDDDQKYVIQGLYSWWLRDSLDLIEESYGLTFKEADTTNSRLKLKFIEDPSTNMLAYVSFEGDGGKTYESRTLCVNMAHFKKMNIKNRHGSVIGGMSLDRTLVHELVHGIMASNLNYFSDLPMFLVEGGTAELVHGIDDERHDNIIYLMKNPSKIAKVLTALGDYNKDPDYEVYSGGYIFMRYFAKQASDTTFDYDTYRETVSISSKGGFATNYWDNVTMKGGKGNDTITNSGENVYITAGAGKDTIKNYSDKVIINSGADDDSIKNEGAQVLISGGKGGDVIHNTGNKSTVSGGNGVDFIVNNGSSSSINGDAGNDSITNKPVTVNVLDGIPLEVFEKGFVSANESIIINSGDTASLMALSIEFADGIKSTVHGGTGEDAIYNYGGKVRVYGDEDNDKLINYGFKSKIYGGAGNDSIVNENDTMFVSIKELDVDGKVSVEGSESTLYGGDGNDTINNKIDEVKIYGQNDNDEITNGGEDVSIFGGAGNDIVDNDGENVYISLGDGDDSLINNSEAIKAYGGKGADVFINEGEENKLYGDDGDDYFVNFGDGNSIIGGAGNDTLYSSGHFVLIDGGDNKDKIISEGVTASIFGGKGNDLIQNSGDHATIDGGKGNDSIETSGRYCFATGGKGNDSLWGGKYADTFIYSAGGGKDIIFGFDSKDTLTFDGIDFTSATYSKKNGSVTFKVDDGGSVTLKEFTATTFNVNNDVYTINSKNKFVKTS